MSGFGFGAKGGGGGGSTALVPITDGAIIANITNDSNWNDDGNYTGSIVGLVDCNFYYEDGMAQKYEFFGGVLRRFTFNTLKGDLLLIH